MQNVFVSYMAKHTLAVRGHSSPFSCQDCSIFFLACGKVFYRAEEKKFVGGLQVVARPLGVPPSSGWSARKDCRFQLAARPQGIPFSSGRTETTGTTETTEKWQAMLPRLATGPREGNAAAHSHWPVRRPRAYSWREAHPRHNPSGPGTRRGARRKRFGRASRPDWPVGGPPNDKGRGLRRALRVNFRFARKLFPLP